MNTRTMTLADGRTVLVRADLTVTIDRRGAASRSGSRIGTPATPREPNHIQWSLESGSVGHYWARRTTRTEPRRGG